MSERLNNVKRNLSNVLESNYIMTGWAVIGIVAVSFLTGSLFVHETTDYTVVKNEAKRYSWNADQLCNKRQRI